MPATKRKNAVPMSKTKNKPKAKAPSKSMPTAARSVKKLSALDAAAQVLGDSNGSMTAKELIEVMATQKLWASPNGKTPAATLTPRSCVR